MHTNFPSLDFCVLCRIIRGEKATFRDIPEEIEIKEVLQLDTDTIVIGEFNYFLMMSKRKINVSSILFIIKKIVLNLKFLGVRRFCGYETHFLLFP